MADTELQAYLDLSPQQIRMQLVDIQVRDLPLPGKRQGPFNAVETLLCYGLFSLIDPHHYGGINIDQVPADIRALAAFFRRTPGSITSKMLNLDHRFVQEVLRNCGRTCVFCGFAPHTLPDRNGLLRTSHIKPRAVSNQHERLDVHNGLIACPMHDTAFDQGYLTIDDRYLIRKALMLQESIEHDYQVGLFFRDVLGMSLLLPPRR